MRNVVLLLAACTRDEGTPVDTDTTPDPPAVDTGETGTPGPATYAPTWAGVQQLFDESCDGCHPTKQGFDLHHDLQYPPGPDDAYVVPFEPERSSLWGSVTGRYPLALMPPTGLLPAETVKCIEDWILAGAIYD